MKKRNLIFAAAMSAVMAMSVTAAPCAYAVKDTAVAEAAEDEQAEETNKLEFKKQNKFSSYKSAQVKAIGDDGTLYCMGFDRDGAEFFSADSEGNVLNSYRIDHYNDGDLVIGVGEARAKILDDGVLLMYTKAVANKMIMGSKGTVIVKLDKELNEVSRYEAAKCTAFDSNGKRLVTLKGNKIYLSDINGKNKKLVYTVNGEKGMDHVYYVAISDTHIGFGGQGGYSADTRYYSGVIDIETGEVTIKQQDRGIWDVEAMNNSTLVWKTDTGYYDESTDEHSSDPFSGFKDYKNHEYYLFDGEKFDTFRTEDSHETLIMDSDGNFITYDIWKKNGNAEFKLYKDGKAADSYTFTNSDDGIVSVMANGGTAAVCTTVHPEGADTGWHAYTPGDPVEYQEPFPINVTIITYDE